MNPHDDLVSSIKENFSPECIVEEAIAYFKSPRSELVFPAKSYAVAIIYAYLIQKHFNTEFYTSLDDHDLLGGNDKYFVRYSSSKKIYDEIIESVQVFGPDFCLNLQLEQIATTVYYFNLEFGIR